MTILVFAEHDNKTVRKATLNAVTAAQKIGGDIHVLVAGHNCGDAANAACAPATNTPCISARRTARGSTAFFPAFIGSSLLFTIARVGSNPGSTATSASCALGRIDEQARSAPPADGWKNTSPRTSRRGR